MNGSELSRLLGLMKDGRVHSKESLVSGLGISEGMADLMIEDLVRAGYLEQLGGELGSDICSRCERNRGSGAECGLCLKPGRAWLLTPKGMKAATG